MIAAAGGKDHKARKAIEGGQEKEFEKMPLSKSINECFYLNC